MRDARCNGAPFYVPMIRVWLSFDANRRGDVAILDVPQTNISGKSVPSLDGVLGWTGFQPRVVGDSES